MPFERRLEPLGVGLVLVVPFVPKIFWFGPFERSEPLSVRFALVVPKVFWFGPFERSKPLGVFCTCCAFVLISMQSLRILHTLLTYCFVWHADACRSLPFWLLRRE